LTCSAQCLEKHLVSAHGPDIPRHAELRAKVALATMNRRDPDFWERYAPHRHRLMNAACSPGAHGDIAVFGAGNGTDVDVDTLSRSFNQIHLIDLDTEAIERARDRLPSRLRDRTFLHGDVDLSGFLDRLDEWAEGVPPPETWGRPAMSAAHRNVARIGRTFDFALSTCVLSQLPRPYHRAWVASLGDWQVIEVVISAVYLASVTGVVHAGGSGFIAIDVLGSDRARELEAMSRASDAQLHDFVEQRLDRDGWEPNPDPRQLVTALRTLVSSPGLIQPWLWDVGAHLRLVYGLSFSKS